VLKRQKTVLGIVMREVRRKMIHLDPQQAAVIRLEAVLERAQRLPYAATQGQEQALRHAHA
jgi:hypothetical protein